MSSPTKQLGVKTNLTSFYAEIVRTIEHGTKRVETHRIKRTRTLVLKTEGELKREIKYKQNEDTTQKTKMVQLL